MLPKHQIPHLKYCKEYIERCGYKYSHKSIIGSYVFYSIKTQRQVAFTLLEIRNAVKYGW
jgi:hypothetical protein